MMTDDDNDDSVSVFELDNDMKAVRFEGFPEVWNVVRDECGVEVHSSTNGYYIGDGDPYRGDKHKRGQTLKRGDWIVKGRFGDVYTFSPQKFESLFGDAIDDD